MEVKVVKFFKISNSVIGDGDANLPSRGSEEAAGYDIESAEDFVLYSGQRHMFKTGVGCILPPNTVGKLEPRSKLANKFGIMVLAGTIDEDYRGEIRVILFNSGVHPFEVKKGDRIVQMLIDENNFRSEAEWVDPLEIDSTVRGQEGIESKELRM